MLVNEERSSITAFRKYPPSVFIALIYNEDITLSSILFAFIKKKQTNTLLDFDLLNELRRKKIRKKKTLLLFFHIRVGFLGRREGETKEEEDSSLFFSPFLLL